MLKKILLMLMAALMMVTPVMAEDMVTTTAEAEPAAFELTKEQEVLIGLDLISTNSYGVIDNAKVVTREDFASVVGAMLNIDPTYAASETYYLDVAPETWSTHTINKLAEMGVLSVPSDRMFRPNDNITYNEAIKMLVCLLGYGDMAATRGGWPTGYTTVAHAIDLTDGVKTSGALTQDVMAKLVYNALHIDMMKVQSAGGKYVEFSDEEENTLLSLYHDIYYVEGNLNTINGIGITSKYVAPGYCKIGAEAYALGDLDVANLLGYNVCAYYKADGTSKTLVYVIADETTTITIYDNQTPNYTGDVLYYYDEEADKDKKVKLAKDVTVVHNGAVRYTKIKDAFKITNGEIRLVDAEDDSIFETVFIEDYETFLVKTVNINDTVLVSDIDDTKPIKLSDDVIPNLWVYDGTGAEIPFETISVESVIDLAISQNSESAIIYTTNEIVEGTVTSVVKGENTICIDGTEYTVIDGIIDRYKIELGKGGQFKVNKYGKIAYYTETALSGKAGLVMDMEAGQGMDATYKVKMLTQDNKIEIFEMANKAKVDGVVPTAADLETILAENIYSVVLYRTNSKGKISYLDTKVQAETEDNSTLRYGMSTSSTPDVYVNRYTSGAKVLGVKNNLNENAIIFKMPRNPEVYTSDDSYKVTTLSEWTDYLYYMTDLYKTDGDVLYDIIVWKEDPFYGKAGDPYLICKSVKRGVNNDGEPVTIIEAYNSASIETIEVPADYDILPAKGDVFRYKANEKGVVGAIEVHIDLATRGAKGNIDPYSYSGAYSGMTGVANFGRLHNAAYYDILNANRLLIGQIYEIQNNLIRMNLNMLEGTHYTGLQDAVDIAKLEDGETVEANEKAIENSIQINVPIKTNTQVIVYDYNTDKFYVGSVADIRPYKTYGFDASEIVINTKSGSPTTIYVVNNYPRVYDRD